MQFFKFQGNRSTNTNTATEPTTNVCRSSSTVQYSSSSGKTTSIIGSSPSVRRHVSSTSTSIALRLIAVLAVAVAVLFVLHLPPGTDALPVSPGSGGNFEFKRYCSNTLSDAIRLICGGRFNSLSREFPESVGSGRALKRFASDDNIFYRPTPNGPIHECCRRPCGYSELKMYCAPD